MKRTAKRATATIEHVVGILAGIASAILLGIGLGALFAVLWLPLGAFAALLGVLWGWNLGQWIVRD
jgi:hypothetical protein